MKLLTVVTMGSVIFCGSMAWGNDLPSLEKGRQLFASEQLGTSGRSCATCHPDGSKLKGAAILDNEELAATINQCITGPLKGKPLEPDSADMKSLLLYLKSLAGTAK